LFHGNASIKDEIYAKTSLSARLSKMAVLFNLISYKTNSTILILSAPRGGVSFTL